MWNFWHVFLLFLYICTSHRLLREGWLTKYIDQHKALLFMITDSQNDGAWIVVGYVLSKSEGQENQWHSSDPDHIYSLGLEELVVGSAGVNASTRRPENQHTWCSRTEVLYFSVLGMSVAWGDKTLFSFLW